MYYTMIENEKDADILYSRARDSFTPMARPTRTPILPLVNLRNIIKREDGKDFLAADEARLMLYGAYKVKGERMLLTSIGSVGIIVGPVVTPDEVAELEVQLG